MRVKSKEWGFRNSPKANDLEIVRLRRTHQFLTLTAW